MSTAVRETVGGVVRERGPTKTVQGGQRRGLREISNIPVPLARKVAALKISAAPAQSKPVRAPEPQPARPPRENVEDVDRQHSGNVFLVSEYARDVYSYLMGLEARLVVERRPLAGARITDEMRRILVDWLVDVHLDFNLLQETLQAGVGILDRFLQVELGLDKEHFQLAGITALNLAAKYEEVFSPSLDDLVYVCKNAYTKRQILQMEKKILNSLDFNLGRPVSIVFLRRYNMVAKADKLQHCYSKYFADSVLLDASLCHVAPSLIAAGAAYLAMCITKQRHDPALWSASLVHYSGYSPGDAVSAAAAVATSVLATANSKYDSVRRKYANSPLLSVSIKTLSLKELLKTIARTSSKSTLDVLK